MLIVAPGGRFPQAARRHVSLSSSDLSNGTAGCGDLLLRRGTERVRRHLQGHAVELAGTQYLDRVALADRARFDQLDRADRPAVREQLRQPLQVDHLVRDLEAVPEALELGQPHVDGHLPTLERRRDVLPGLGTLGAAARGLALGPLAATHPGLGGLGPRRRAQVVDLDRHYSTSSTFTRWVTVKIMPRISGRSSFTTTSLIRFRPSVRSVSRWLRLHPILDRTWVTFSRPIVFTPPARPGRPAWPPARRPRPAGHGAWRRPPATPASGARPPRRARY